MRKIFTSKKLSGKKNEKKMPVRGRRRCPSSPPPGRRHPTASGELAGGAPRPPAAATPRMQEEVEGGGEGAPPPWIWEGRRKEKMGTACGRKEGCGIHWEGRRKESCGLPVGGRRGAGSRRWELVVGPTTWELWRNRPIYPDLRASDHHLKG